MDLRLLRNELRQDAAETQRILAKRRSHPVVASGRRVSFIENQVDDLEHRRQTSGELVSARNLEGDVGLGESPLGPDDALGDSRLRHEECTRDLLGRQTSEQAEGERDPRLRRENRMAGREHQAQEVVSDVIVDRAVEIRHGHLLLCIELATKFLVLALEELFSAEQVDRTMLRRGHQPGAWVVRDPRLRPLLQRGDEGILCELLGKTDVAHDPRETGDDFGGLDPPDRVDRSMCVGSRHGYPITPSSIRSCKPARAATTCSWPSVCPRIPMLWDRSLPARTFGESRSRLPSPASVSCEVP